MPKKKKNRLFSSAFADVLAESRARELRSSIESAQSYADSMRPDLDSLFQAYGKVKKKPKKVKATKSPKEMPHGKEMIMFLGSNSAFKQFRTWLNDLKWLPSDYESWIQRPISRIRATDLLQNTGFRIVTVIHPESFYFTCSQGYVSDMEPVFQLIEEVRRDNWIMEDPKDSRWLPIFTTTSYCEQYLPDVEPFDWEFNDGSETATPMYTSIPDPFVRRDPDHTVIVDHTYASHSRPTDLRPLDGVIMEDPTRRIEVRYDNMSDGSQQVSEITEEYDSETGRWNVIERRIIGNTSWSTPNGGTVTAEGNGWVQYDPPSHATYRGFDEWFSTPPTLDGNDSE